jgi:hypothetical protein
MLGVKVNDDVGPFLVHTKAYDKVIPSHCSCLTSLPICWQFCFQEQKSQVNLQE